MERRKRDNETNLEYAMRLYSNKSKFGLTNKQIYELYIEETGDIRGESTIRGEVTHLLRGFELGRQYALKSKDIELINKLEEKEIALKEERVRLADVRRRLNKDIRENARYKNNIDILRDCIGDLESYKPFKVIDITGSYENYVAVLNFSDLHAGINIRNHFNVYNMDICKERVQRLTELTINKCVKDEVSKIHILINGDLISGSIHKSLVANADVSLVNSITMASEIISNMIYEIAKYIPTVSVHMAIGNHSRMNPNKNEHIDRDNFEYLIFEFIKLRLSSIDNVLFADNTYADNIMDFYIGDKLYIATHGDKDTNIKKVASGITSLTNIKPKAIFLGHLHHYISEDFNGCIVKYNGSIVGTDDYAVNLRLNTEPYQLLTIYDMDGEEECEYKLRLS